jgi:hypothetical protein
MANHRNVEARCAHFGSQIVINKGEAPDPKRLQTITRNALAVMREEGLFAFYLYLQYRWKEGGRVIWPQVRSLWRDDSVGDLLGAGRDREQVIALTGQLDDLMLAREVAERALVYALYGLRSEDGS